MYDVVGGGFARYSTDAYWLIPHFEKMLYDNAMLSQVYLHAWMVTGIPKFKQVCEETFDFVIREMTHPQGGFYSSLDADSEGEEGKFYTWTLDEINASLDPQSAAFAITAYNLSPDANFDGKNVLQLARTDDQLAELLRLPAGEIPGRFRELHRQLLAFRSKRIRPGTDDKILTAWNALMLISFAEAARYLQRMDYLEVAKKNAHFLLEHLMTEGRLMRSWRDGQAKYTAYLEDHAALDSCSAGPLPIRSGSNLVCFCNETNRNDPLSFQGCKWWIL